MHRSGTSAVAGLLHRLGLATCVPDDLISGMAWNPRGHWESRSLSNLNEHLLAEMGHTWWYPPPSGSAYAAAAARVTVPPGDAAGAFDRVHPEVPWVWKDPRSCLTLPYWRQALDRPLAAVVVYRDPVDVATSLGYRNSLPLPVGVALWERYTRLLLAHAAGLPVLVTSYDDLVRDPVAWARTAQSFLDGLGIGTGRGSVDEEGVLEFIDPGLRHSHTAGLDPGPAHDVAPFRGPGHDAGPTTGTTGTTGLPPGAAEVLDALHARRGPHLRFVTPDLGGEDPGVEVELRSRWPDRPPGWNQPPWPVEGAVPLG
jgi:hypothetical protein